jgi:hypothetical protein
MTTEGSVRERFAIRVLRSADCALRFTDGELVRGLSTDLQTWLIPHPASLRHEVSESDTSLGSGREPDPIVGRIDGVCSE